MAIKNDVQLTIGAKDRTSKALKSVRAGLDRTVKSAGLVGSVGAFALGRLVSGTAQAQDEVGKLSARYNISTEAIAAFGRQADLTGTSQAAVNKSLEKMNKNIGDAAAGFGMARPMLEALNLQVEDLKRLSADEQYLQIADAISELGTAAEQSSAAQAIFGRSGGQMLNMIREGREGFEAAKQEVIDYGVALSGIKTKEIENMNDEMTRTQGVLEGVSTQLTSQLSPFIRQIAVDFNASARQGKGFGDTIETVINNVIAGVGFMLDAWHGFNVVVKGTELALAAVGEGILSVVGWFTDVEGAIGKAEERTQGLQKEFDELVNKEMPSNNIKQWAEEAKIASLEAAEAVMSVSKATGVDVLDVTNKDNKDRKKGEKDVADFIKKTRTDTKNLSVGLLRTLGSENKAFAVAAIGIEKGLAVAEAYMNTGVAYTKALKYSPAYAATVASLGYAKVGLIAATGLGQIGAVTGGGGGAGAPTEIATTAEDIREAQETAPADRGTTVIQVSPGLYDQNAIIELAEKMAELRADGMDVRATVV